MPSDMDMQSEMCESSRLKAGMTSGVCDKRLLNLLFPFSRVILPPEGECRG